MSMGNAFTKHYDLYMGDNEHSALLHRLVLYSRCGRLLKYVIPLELICGTPCVYYLRYFPLSVVYVVRTVTLLEPMHDLMRFNWSREVNSLDVDVKIVSVMGCEPLRSLALYDLEKAKTNRMILI